MSERIRIYVELHYFSFFKLLGSVLISGTSCRLRGLRFPFIPSQGDGYECGACNAPCFLVQLNSLFRQASLINAIQFQRYFTSGPTPDKTTMESFTSCAILESWVSCQAGRLFGRRPTELVLNGSQKTRVRDLSRTSIVTSPVI